MFHVNAELFCFFDHCEASKSMGSKQSVRQKETN